MNHNILGLYTIPKSGTNYFRIFLVNYLYYISGHKNENKSYDDVAQEFPLLITDIIKNSKAPRNHPITMQFGYSDFCYNHGRPLNPPNGRYIMLYRNPLDYLVSSYFYLYEHRNETAGLYKKPIEVMDKVFMRFLGNYPVMKKFNAEREEYLLVSYEDIFEFPHKYFKQLVEHYRLPFDEEALNFAIDNASIHKVRKFETESNKRLHTRNEATFVKGTHFTRNGNIGQWQEFFSEEDIELVKNQLLTKNIQLDEFRLYPSQKAA